jgi:hypothetical protein
MATGSDDGGVDYHCAVFSDYCSRFLSAIPSSLVDFSGFLVEKMRANEPLVPIC